MLRVVLDPGVLISALLSGEGPPGQVVDRWRAGEFDLVVSPKLLDEPERVLLRPKFEPYVTEADARKFVRALSDAGVTVADPPTESGLTRDPGDDYLVSLARAARADVLVSGDPHLTEVAGLRPAAITPRAFLERLANDS